MNSYRSVSSLEVMRQLRYRHRLVKMRTMVKNSLHAIALGGGLSIQSKIGTVKNRQRLQALALPLALAGQRDEWLNLLETLDGKIGTAEQWLTAAAESNERVMQLQTHPGIGLITSLALVHTLEPVTRFPTARKVVAYVGLDPVEHSSAEKNRYGSISKGVAGSCASSWSRRRGRPWAAIRSCGLFTTACCKGKRAKARVAVARKVLTRGYIMLRDGIDYAEFLRRGVEARSARCVA